MTTFARDLVDSLDARWSEINLLIAEAESRASDIDLYNAICRSISVLMVAQFEGFTRDAARAILDDINTFSSFRQAPSALKQTFCRSFLEKEDGVNSKELQSRIQKLISTFDGLETKFTLEPFLVRDSHDYNKNPSPSVIDRITENFGVRKFFTVLDGSDLDAVFSDTAPEVDKLKNRIKSYVITGVENYPYILDSAAFNVGVVTVQMGTSTGKKRTFWEDFLDNVMSKRHGIAHGSISNNPNSVEEIRSSLVKLEILQLAILMMVCEKSV